MVIARLYFGITSLLTDYFLSGSVASFMYRLAKSISTSSSASSAFKQNVVQAKCYMNKKDTPEQYLCSRYVINTNVIYEYGKPSPRPYRHRSLRRHRTGDTMISFRSIFFIS